jgi:hypothetical protein
MRHTMPNIIDEYRVYSRLSGFCYFQNIDDKRYMFVGGMCLPCYLGVALILWVMTGGGTYKNAVGKKLSIDELVLLNPGDANIKKLSRTTPMTALHWLYSQMYTIMKDWEPKDFDRLVVEHLDAFHEELAR